MDFRHILFPVDFSRRAHGAAPLIRAMAQRFEAKLTLLHAADEPYPWYGGLDAPILPELEWPDIEAEASRRLSEFAAAEFPNFPCQTVVRQGEPASAAIAYSEEANIDLIAMPTHGRGVFRSALLGSVTAKILHDSRCAVWTDAHSATGSVPWESGWGSILCAIDTTEESLRLIQAAAELGSRFKGKVRLVHAVPGAEAGQEKYFDLEFQRFLEDSARQAIAKLQSQTGTDFEVCLGAGTPGRIVAAAAEHHAADLVVIGHGHLRGVAGRFRTHAYGIVRSAPCPVLSL